MGRMSAWNGEFYDGRSYPPQDLTVLLDKLKTALKSRYKLELEASELAKALPSDLLEKICDDTYSRPHNIHQASQKRITEALNVLNDHLADMPLNADKTAINDYVRKLAQIGGRAIEEEGLAAKIIDKHPSIPFNLSDVRSKALRELDDAARATENLANPAVTKSFVGRHWGKMAGAAAVVAAGGWALHEMSKRSEAEGKAKSL